jgi:hypothetical protein
MSGGVIRLLICTTFKISALEVMGVIRLVVTRDQNFMDHIYHRFTQRWPSIDTRLA